VFLASSLKVCSGFLACKTYSYLVRTRSAKRKSIVPRTCRFESGLGYSFIKKVLAIFIHMIAHTDYHFSLKKTTKNISCNSQKLHSIVAPHRQLLEPA